MFRRSKQTIISPSPVFCIFLWDISLDPQFFGEQTLNHHLGGRVLFANASPRDTSSHRAIQHLMDQGQNLLTLQQGGPCKKVML